MKLKYLFEILSGFTTAFVIYGFIKGDFVWSSWFSILIGGTIGYFILDFLKNKKKRQG